MKNKKNNKYKPLKECNSFEVLAFILIRIPYYFIKEIVLGIKDDKTT